MREQEEALIVSQKKFWDASTILCESLTKLFGTIEQAIADETAEREREREKRKP